MLLIRSENPRRCQAENPLEPLSEFPGPALSGTPLRGYRPLSIVCREAAEKRTLPASAMDHLRPFDARNDRLRSSLISRIFAAQKDRSSPARGPRCGITQTTERIRADGHLPGRRPSIIFTVALNLVQTVRGCFPTRRPRHLQKSVWADHRLKCVQGSTDRVPPWEVHVRQSRARNPPSRERRSLPVR
jgi:hypothetical protein